MLNVAVCSSVQEVIMNIEDFYCVEEDILKIYRSDTECREI